VEPVKTIPSVVAGPIEIRSEADAIVALDRATRTPLWRVAAAPVTPGTIAKDRFYIGAAGAIECRSLLDGRLIWSRETAPLPGVAPLVSRGRLLFATKDALMLLDVESADAKPSVWMDTSWLGGICGPMTLKDSHVYAPVTGWGLVCMGGAK
jgi:outer membrane protein assembly factor BamB